MVNALHPAEIALLIESLPPAQRELVWDMVEPELEGDVLVELNENIRAKLIEGMEDEELLAVAEGMEVDDLAHLVADLPETVTLQLLRSLDQQDRERLSTVLSFPDDSAGSLMNMDTISLRPDVTVIHAQQADREGNVQLWSITGIQKEAVLAARAAVVTVEEIVEVLEPKPGGVILPAWTIDVVSHVPGGAHPSYAHGYTERDNDFYLSWAAISRDRKAFRAWMEAHVLAA